MTQAVPGKYLLLFGRGGRRYERLRNFVQELLGFVDLVSRWFTSIRSQVGSFNSFIVSPMFVAEKRLGKIGTALLDEFTVHHHQRLRRDRRGRAVSIGNGGIGIVEQLKYVVDIVTNDGQID